MDEWLTLHRCIVKPDVSVALDCVEKGARLSIDGWGLPWMCRLLQYTVHMADAGLSWSTKNDLEWCVPHILYHWANCQFDELHLEHSAHLCIQKLLQVLCVCRKVGRARLHFQAWLAAL